MRHPEPAIVTQYRQTLKAEPPRVCHTCDHYRPDGVCAEFGEAPPPEFPTSLPDAISSAARVRYRQLHPTGHILWELRPAQRPQR